MSAHGIPPLVLVSGPEELLVERAVASVVTAMREVTPDLEVITLEGAGYGSGDLLVQTSPSLFGGTKCVVVTRVEEGNDALIEELTAYAGQVAEDVVLVATHRGGVRGKRALEALKKAKARVIDCPEVKSDSDKSGFVTQEFRAAGRRIDGAAVVALVQAVGSDLRELAAACAQLVADTDAVVTADIVERYHGGKVEATAFKIADEAVAGHVGEALRLLRHALATGVDPVPIVAVLAQSLRGLAKVCGAGRGSSGQVAKSVGMAPWQVDKARRSLTGWNDEGLGQAIRAVVAADFEVKGGGRDPVYAVERAIIAMAQARHG